MAAWRARIAAIAACWSVGAGGSAAITAQSGRLNTIAFHVTPLHVFVLLMIPPCRTCCLALESMYARGCGGVHNAIRSAGIRLSNARQVIESAANTPEKGGNDA